MSLPRHLLGSLVDVQGINSNAPLGTCSMASLALIRTNENRIKLGKMGF